MYLCIYVCVYIYIYLSIYPSIHPSIYQSIYPSLYPSLWLLNPVPIPWKPQKAKALRPSLHLELLWQRLHWPLRGIFLQPRGGCSHVFGAMDGQGTSLGWTGSTTTGWWFQPLRKILVSWDDSSQYMENKKCSKPPTRWTPNHEHHGFWPQKGNKPSRQLPRPFETSVTPRCCSLQHADQHPSDLSPGQWPALRKYDTKWFRCWRGNMQRVCSTSEINHKSTINHGNWFDYKSSSTKSHNDRLL
jgi:hypothetical protein